MVEQVIPHTFLHLRPPPGTRFLQAMQDGRQVVLFEYQKGREKEITIWLENWILNHLIPPVPMKTKTVQVPVNEEIDPDATGEINLHDDEEEGD